MSRRKKFGGIKTPPWVGKTPTQHVRDIEQALLGNEEKKVWHHRRRRKSNRSRSRGSLADSAQLLESYPLHTRVELYLVEEHGNIAKTERGVIERVRDGQLGVRLASGELRVVIGDYIRGVLDDEGY